MINAIHFYFIANWLYKKKIPLLPKCLELLIFLLYNSKISASTTIGRGSRFAYGGIGCVIHNRAVLGKNCMIGTNVTIGGRSDFHDVPVIGDDVYIATGAKVLGPIHIGNNAVIGANAVVIKNVDEKTTVAGIPAKVIPKKTVETIKNLIL